MLWIPITIAAAAFQTARNAFQRGLTGRLSPLGATYTRFVFGLPFAALYGLIVFGLAGTAPQAPHTEFLAWVALGGIGQLLATAALIHLFQLRNFSAGIAFSKTEIVLAAVFGLAVLHDPVTWVSAGAIAIATAGLVFLARDTAGAGWRETLAGLGARPALLGFASGAGLAVASVSFRAASLSLETLGYAAAAAQTLVVALCIQTALMTGYLAVREPGQVGKVFRQWRASLAPGLTGAAASASWFTAMTLEPVAHVRMLGLVEIPFSFAVTMIAFGQRPGRRELIGTALLLIAIVALLGEQAARPG